jgi:hypothetical protein
MRRRASFAESRQHHPPAEAPPFGIECGETAGDVVGVDEPVTPNAL